MVRAYLGLGSNVGNRAEWLRRAIRALNGNELKIVRLSTFYETSPVGYDDQGWFLNQVVEVVTSLPPERLLEKVLSVELKLGRERFIVNGPRNIDIDILLYGDLAMHSDSLTIPHPRYRSRRFVLAPLAELCPDRLDPETGMTVAELLVKAPDAEVRRLEHDPSH